MLHDLRQGSPTDGATLCLDVDADNAIGVFIPPGVAHGFATLTDLTIAYMVDGYYNPADELGRGVGRPRGGSGLGRHRPGAFGAGPGQPVAG